jgi:hypothetical protein
LSWARTRGLDARTMQTIFVERCSFHLVRTLKHQSCAAIYTMAPGPQGQPRTLCVVIHDPSKLAPYCLRPSQIWTSYLCTCTHHAAQPRIDNPIGTSRKSGKSVPYSLKLRPVVRLCARCSTPSRVAKDDKMTILSLTRSLAWPSKSGLVLLPSPR